jgi:streptogramin lyase
VPAPTPATAASRPTRTAACGSPRTAACGVTQIDHKTNTLIKFHPLNPCSTPVGVSVDLEGFVWVVDEYIGWAWKIDPKNVPAMQKVDNIGDHYTYSDMTGGQLKSVILPQ